MSLAELSGPRGFMAVTANQITGDVPLSLPEVDIMDPNDPTALCEGCSSTYHSAEWGKMCNEKLKALGSEFGWKIRSTTSFVGIGSKSNTLGTRQMPFALLAETNEIVKGHCESYEVDKGSTPMLLSLYAQCTLGMIKDLEQGTCSVKHDDGTRRTIPLFKCRKTGLLLIITFFPRIVHIA